MKFSTYFPYNAKLCLNGHEYAKRQLAHADQERIAYLEKKIQAKDEVLAELMAEHVALKKTLGEL